LGDVKGDTLTEAIDHIDKAFGVSSFERGDADVIDIGIGVGAFGDSVGPEKAC
jgi:hypothetical protein